MIYSNSLLDEQIKFISWNLGNNGFPLDLVIRIKIFDFNLSNQLPVYLHYPW